jgi:Uma2 family endonuclease
MSALLENLPHYTYDDYLHWQGRWELIYGVPYAMSPAPSINHQSISQNISVALNKGLKECDQCIALLPVDWKIDDEIVVQPDNLVVCYQPSGNFLTKAPSVIFEILSKSTAHKDLNTKFKLYEKEGVNYYIIVFPDDSVAKVYELKNGKYQKLLDATDEKVDFIIKNCSINFDFARIWT